MFRNILVPTDFSEKSKSAGRIAASYAKTFGAELTLLHVVDIPDYLFGVPEYAVVPPVELLEAQRTKAHKDLEAFLDQDLEGVPVHRVLLEGPPAREIVQYADSYRIDLIMMPTHGLGTFRRFIVGSTTAKVLHDAHCAVWTDAHLQDNDRPDPMRPHRILCALDLGPQSEALLDSVSTLASSLNARVYIVHAVPSIEVRPASYFDVDFTAELLRQARERIAEVQRNAGTNFQVCVHGGEPHQVIDYAAREHGADLTVIARGHVKEGLGRLRTHSYSIINKSSCPVLSI